MSDRKAVYFYNDRERYEGDFPPARGVQVIVQESAEVGVELVTGADYYVKETWGWRGVDIFGLFDYLMESGVVLFGRTISREEYNQVMREACEFKTGWLPTERKP